MKKTGLLLGALIALMSTLHGGMVFEKRLIEVHAAPDADLVTAEFSFRVDGDRPVTITEYEAACSCLSAEISDGGRLVWKPGERGMVRGLFKMGTFKGTVDKHIVLRLKDQPHPETLTVRVHIPVLFELEPQTLFWDLSGKAEAQSFKIKVNHDKPIHIKDLSCTNEQFGYELKTVKDGWEYEIEVTPKSVATRAFGMLRIRTDCEFERHQSAQAFVVVRQPKPGS